MARVQPAQPGSFAPARPTKEQKAEAAKVAHAHNLHETALMLGRLKTLPEVRGRLEEQSKRWGLAEPQALVAEVLRWWLRPVCPACNGTKFDTVPGTARLSARACKACRGLGHLPVPGGAGGWRLASFIDECVHSARGDIGARLRSRMGRA